MSCQCKLFVFLRLLRRCQALLLSHEGATGHEVEPYLQHVLKPLAPLTLYGRFAAREPKCHKQECVYYFWRGRHCHEVTGKCFSLLCFQSLQLSHWFLAIVLHSFVSADL